jgi:hypothetical protein
MVQLSTVDLAFAREASADLLASLGLETFVFDLEPGEERWHLKVDCAVDDGWQSVTVPVQKAMLLAARQDPEVRAQLLATWAAAIGVTR